MIYNKITLLSNSLIAGAYRAQLPTETCQSFFLPCRGGRRQQSGYFLLHTRQAQGRQL